ncbi:MAG TPA: hypothetical protein VHE78_15555 [Gemmatimonadaceae bacterium]|nr:hypothetical protein [Gemmatimonadaceae bacterium]
MAAKAQEISMEAGSKMAAAMKDVINAAAGLTSFAIESSRDLVQYMVRRGQMTQEEADKLIREAEDSWSKKHKGKKPPARVHEPPSLKSIAKPFAIAVAPMPPLKAPPAVKPAVVKQPARKVTAAKKKPTAKKNPAAGKKSAAKKKPTARKKLAAKK